MRAGYDSPLGGAGNQTGVVTDRSTKICAACGRTIEWRKKWERSWDEVQWCSQACRRRKVSAVDHQLEASIQELLDKRTASATLCPSEAARAVAATNGLTDDAWRSLMEPARAAARRLVAAGDVVITQKGRIVDPSTAKGPIRIRRVS